MQVKNKSQRPYHVGGKMIAPGATEKDLPASVAADIRGMDDLEVIKEAQAETVEFKEVEHESKKTRASKDKAE